jgi:hypothetical protein
MASFIKNKQEFSFVTPFTCFLFAMRRSGKTCLTLNMLFNEKLLKNKFDRIYLFSPTAHLDKCWIHSGIPPKQRFSTFDQAEIKKLMRYQSWLASQGDEMEDILIILDDCQNESKIKSSHMKQNAADELASIGRHFNISLITISQNLKSMSPNFCSNQDYAIAFRLRNRVERKAFFERFDVTDSSNPKEFEKKYRVATNPKYGFITVDTVNNKLWNKFNNF